MAIYSKEDKIAAHRFAADESYRVGQESSTPVGAYLDHADIVRVCKENGVDAVHPGYGFLSESAPFARACEREGKLYFFNLFNQKFFVKKKVSN